jgi:hypothetical protein
MRGMVINMEEAKLQALVQIKAFLNGTSGVVFRVPKNSVASLSGASSSGFAMPRTGGYSAAVAIETARCDIRHYDFEQLWK